MRIISYYTLILALFIHVDAATLINNELRNGGFESDNLFPWQDFSASGLTLGTDSDFAYSGTQYAIMSGISSGVVARTTALQSVPIDISYGNLLNISFWVRGSDTYALDWVAVSLSDSLNQQALVSPVLLSTVLPHEWQQLSYNLTLPETWDYNNDSSLRIRLLKQGGIPGMVYSSYLDEVELQSIPEPHLLAILLVSISLFFLKRTRNLV